MSSRRLPLRWAGRTIAVLLAAGFVALLAFGLLTRAQDTTIDDALATARPVPAPSFDLPVLLRASGAPPAVRAAGPAVDARVSLGELRGSPVVLNFWASWCVPCREEAPLLERTWRAQPASGALFVGVNQQDITDDARAFMREFRISYLNVRDQGNSVARSYGATGLPETFFISATGQVVGHVIGVTSADQLRAGIAAARAGRPLGVRQGGDRRPARGG